MKVFRLSKVSSLSISTVPTAFQNEPWYKIYSEFIAKFILLFGSFALTLISRSKDAAPSSILSYTLAIAINSKVSRVRKLLQAFLHTCSSRRSDRSDGVNFLFAASLGPKVSLKCFPGSTKNMFLKVGSSQIIPKVWFASFPSSYHSSCGVLQVCSEVNLRFLLMTSGTSKSTSVAVFSCIWNFVIAYSLTTSLPSNTFSCWISILV